MSDAPNRGSLTFVGFALLLLALGAGLAWQFARGVRLVPPPEFGVDAGSSSRHSRHPDGSLKYSSLRFRGERGEIRRVAKWDEAGSLDVAGSGLFVDGERERGLSPAEVQALHERPDIEPAPVPALLASEQ